MLFVIEHLEPKLSEWLRIEYSHAARLVGHKRLMITNVKDPSEFHKVEKIARVDRKSVRVLYKQSDILVLDPRAQKKLSPRDLLDKEAMVIGGILGEEPPLGRTRELLTKAIPKALARNLGKGQFAIDGATYMAKQVSEGRSLGDIPIKHGLEVQVSKVYSTSLPYVFPLVSGKPLISSELLDYLKHH